MIQGLFEQAVRVANCTPWPVGRPTLPRIGDTTLALIGPAHGFWFAQQLHGINAVPGRRARRPGQVGLAALAAPKRPPIASTPSRSYHPHGTAG